MSGGRAGWWANGARPSGVYWQGGCWTIRRWRSECCPWPMPIPRGACRNCTGSCARTGIGSTTSAAPDSTRRTGFRCVAGAGCRIGRNRRLCNRYGPNSVRSRGQSTVPQVHETGGGSSVSQVHGPSPADSTLKCTALLSSEQHLARGSES